MFRYTCLNPIAQVGLNGFDDTYEKTEALADADAVLVRSAKMHEMELPEKLCAIARAGAGVIISRWRNVRIRELSYSIRRGQMQMA